MKYKKIKTMISLSSLMLFIPQAMADTYTYRHYPIGQAVIENNGGGAEDRKTVSHLKNMKMVCV